VFNAPGSLVDETKMVSTFTILGQTTFFYGICPACRDRQTVENQVNVL
jgi:hypothetical protein